MGGLGGVTGQPSTWITQLVERLLRHTEDPGWLAGWLTPTLGPTHTHKIHTAQTEVHILFSSLFLFSSQSLIHPRSCPDLWHQCCQDTWLHVGFNQQCCQSMAHTLAHTHRSPLLSTWQKGSMLSFQCDFLFPPACHLRSLGPVSLAPSPCQQPYGYHPNPPAPLCHPLDSFPMPHPPRLELHWQL